MTNEALEEIFHFCEIRHKPMDEAIKDIKKSIFWILTTTILVLLGMVSNIFLNIKEYQSKTPISIEIKIDKDILKQP